jgi:hypothetical protein
MDLALTCTDNLRELVIRARAGDHGVKLIAEARTSTKLTGWDIKTQNLGTNPVCSPYYTRKLILDHLFTCVANIERWQCLRNGGLGGDH